MSSPEPTKPAEGPELSMEDILASIRRILSEEEPAASQPQSVEREDILELDESMMVMSQSEPSQQSGGEPASETERALPEKPEKRPEAASSVSSPEADSGLITPMTAEETAASIVSLMRTLARERFTQTHREGPTIEDLVRAELRPLLKEWLNQHLPSLVERLVQAEIERVVSRTLP
jgi:cell pole-organizing protein PopZ